MAINLNVSVFDTVGGFGGYAGLIATNLEFAGERSWGAWINSNASIEVRVDIAQTPSNTANGSSATQQFLQTVNGINYWQWGTVYEMQTGIDINGAAFDVVITIDPDYIVNSLFFAQNPFAGYTAPTDRVDSVELFEHELGHAFGFNGYWNWNGTPGIDYSPFDRYIVMINGIPHFNGPIAVNVYGGPVPLTINNLYHIGNQQGVTGDNLLGDLMNGVTGLLGKSPGLSLLDVAIAADAGLPYFAAAAEPDLAITLDDAFSSLVPGGSLSVDFTVRNVGGTAAADFDVGLYLSLDPTVTASDQLITFADVAGLAAGGQVSGGFDVTLPTSLLPGFTYYIGVIADDINEIIEVSETNNVDTASLTVQSGNLTSQRDTSAAVLQIFQFLTGATPDFASFNSGVQTITTLNNTFNTAVGWNSYATSLANSPFADEFALWYRPLSRDAFIFAVTEEVFGSGFVTPALQTAYNIYVDYFDNIPIQNDPTGVVRAKGYFIGDMLHQASDIALGPYQAAATTFLVGVQFGTTFYGDSLFA